MNNFHCTTGTIVYDPFRGNMKRRTNGWCVVEIDKEITRYFRWWMKYEKHIHLDLPSWNAHVSIVRGDGGDRVSQQFQHLWKKYHNEQVSFVYQHVGEFHAVRSKLSTSQDDGYYYTVEVECPTFDTIRKELGLKTGWNYHLTFGRTYEYQARIRKNNGR